MCSWQVLKSAMIFRCLGNLLEFESFLTRLQEAVNEIHYLDTAGYTSHMKDLKLEVDAMKRELELGACHQHFLCDECSPS